MHKRLFYFYVVLWITPQLSRDTKAIEIMKAIILSAALFFTGVINAQKGFEDYQDLLIPVYDIPFHSLLDDNYDFSTENLTEENTKIILAEIERILKLYGQDLDSTVRTIPEGISYRDVFDPKQILCLHYKIGDMMIYFGTWNDESGTYVGFTAEKIKND